MITLPRTGSAAVRPGLLVLFDPGSEALAALASAYHVEVADTPARRQAAIAERGHVFRAVLTSGNLGLTAAEIDRMPELGLIAAFGAGYEAIDLPHARSRGISVVNGPGTNDDCVADHALAMLLAKLRRLGALDLACRSGLWRDDVPMPPQLAGSRVGILGLGNIGGKIARRLTGFGVEVGYHGRSPRDVPYRYHSDVVALARWSDHLVIAAPGGPATHHLVGAAVLQALGPTGILVNVGRGSIVATDALLEALEQRWIGGAALDVFEQEPGVPGPLRDRPDVLLSPHAAGSSPQAYTAAVRLFLDNSARHFAGERLLTPLA